MFLVKVCTALEQAKIPYAVVGGHAVALHGAIRGTVDIDIIIAWSLENLKKTEQTFHSLNLFSSVPVTAEEVFHSREDFIRRRHLLAWNFCNPQNPLEQLDLLIHYDLGENAVKKIESIHGNINIINIDTLISMKRESGRPQDFEDIKALELIKK